MVKGFTHESPIQIILKSVLGILFLPFWYAEGLICRKTNRWVFGAWRGERYTDNTRAFFEYINETHPEIETLWITKNKALYQRLKDKGIAVAMTNSWKGRWWMLTAKYAFVSDAASDLTPRLLNHAKIMQLWHGMPLKVIEKKQRDFERRNISTWKKIKTRFRQIVLPYEFPTYSMTLSTSQTFTQIMSEAFEMDSKDVWEIGLTRNDYLFESKTESLIKEVNAKYANPRKYFYMPTWRDTYFSNNEAFDPFSLDFDLAKMESVLEKANAVFFYKGHFLGTDPNNAIVSRRLITIGDADYDELYTVVKDVDVLITDYSSIYFDFLVTGKPMILFPFDEKEFIEHRPTNFPYSDMKATRVYSWKALQQLIEENAALPLPEAEEIQQFNCFTDGKACERLYERIMQDEMHV